MPYFSHYPAKDNWVQKVLHYVWPAWMLAIPALALWGMAKGWW